MRFKQHGLDFDQQIQKYTRESFGLTNQYNIPFISNTSLESVREWCHIGFKVMQYYSQMLPYHNIILLIDGLDEVPTSIVLSLFDLIYELTSCSSAVKSIVITSRTITNFKQDFMSELNVNNSFLLNNREPVVELYSQVEPPIVLLETIKVINNELMRYIKSNPEAIHHIAPRRFKEIVAEVLASYGWEVQLTPETKDGGYDIFAVSQDNAGVRTSWIVECKRYRGDRKVGVDIARSLYAIKGDLHVANAMIATTSSFTRGVKDFKNSRYDFELRDYEAIIDWVNAYRPNPNGKLYIKDNALILPTHN